MTIQIGILKWTAVIFSACLIAACGGDGASQEDAVSESSASAGKSSSHQRVLIADVPGACQVLTQKLAASVLRRSRDEINVMDGSGQGLDEPCTWYFASSPAMGVEQQLTLLVGAPPLTYINTKRDTPEQMQSRLKIISSMLKGEPDYLGEFANGRLYAWDGGSWTKMYLATGLRVAEADGDEPKGEILIQATLNENIDHETRVEHLKAVIQAAAEAFGN